MNLRWLKQHVGVLIAAVVFLVVLGAVIWFVQQATAAKSEIVSALDEQQMQLDRLRDLNPYPSTENIDAIKQDRTQLSKIRESLKQITGRGALAVPDLQRDIDFSQRLREALTALTAEAQRYQVRTPENFAFGFSRYVAAFPCRNPPAKAEECRKLLALLAKQVEVVESFGRLLLHSGIQEVVQIRRTEVEPGPASPDALAAPAVQDPNALYRVLPFEVQFVGDTKSVRMFLNMLSKADLFFAVRTLRIESVNAPKAASVSSGTSAEPEKVATDTLPKPVEQTRLAVTMRLDLIEFPAAQEKEKAQIQPESASK
jgi:hypothetical protein